MRERHQNAIGASRTAVKRSPGPLNYRRGLVVATIAAFVMTFMGAFGTGDVPLAHRLFFWLIIMESGALIGIGASTGIRTWGALIDRPVIEGAAISLLIALPLTLVVLGVTLIFFGGRAPSLDSLAGTFVGVIVVTAVITAINYARGSVPVVVSNPNDHPATMTPHETKPQLSRPKFLDRLPVHLRNADLYALEAEDHYLRVYTSAGSDLLLFRLSDAVDELHGVSGARTHRSWWVSRSAVLSISRADGRAELELVDGTVAPVSRSFVPSLRAEGWFV